MEFAAMITKQQGGALYNQYLGSKGIGPSSILTSAMCVSEFFPDRLLRSHQDQGLAFCCFLW